MSKPALKDPLRIPEAADVDEHLAQFSRYARVVRGAARVAGLSTRLAWTNAGWQEQFRYEDAVLGSLNLVRVPPQASIPVSKALEEQILARMPPEPVRQALHKADGSVVKWIELDLTGPNPADIMALIISLKAELIRTGVVQLTAADRPKQIPRPELPATQPRPVSRPTKIIKPPKAAKKAKAAKPAKKAKPMKAKRAPARKAAAKSAKRR